MNYEFSSFVELLMFPFDIFWGMRGEKSGNVLVLLFMVLWVPIFAMLCKRAVLLLWHASLFLGLRHVGDFFSLFFHFAWWSSLPFLVTL
jgi:hypothetical protein